MKKYRDVDEAYRYVVHEVLEHGTRKENRTGVDTISTFGVHYLLDLQAAGFPMLTTKAVSWKNIVVEMLWFLSGQTDISILKRHGCKFWDSWADEDGKVPSAYGNFWRQFPVHTQRTLTTEHKGRFPEDYEKREEPVGAFNDQIAWVLAEMKRNPMSRRMIVSAWAPGNAQTSKLPPCHAMFVFNVQNVAIMSTNTHNEPDFTPEKVGEERRLCLHLTQRSCDVALGVPYNIASYALLAHIASRISGIPLGDFGHTLIDAHLYTSKPDGTLAEYDHLPGIREQMRRPSRIVPLLLIHPSIQSLADIEALMAPDVTTEHILDMFKLVDYFPHPNIPFKVAV